MNRRLNLAYGLVLLPIACGGRVVNEGDTEGETEGTSSSSEGGSVTVTTTMTTTMSTTDPVTTDPTTTDPATTDPSDTTSPDSSTGGGSENCCEVHASAGCEEEAVAQCVCKTSPDCCVFGWEKNCVDLAMNDCAATCMGDETTGTESESTGEPMACAETVQIDLGADVATLSGVWSLAMSGVGEGMIAEFDFQMDDPRVEDVVAWDVDIPCDDNWYIWVRAYDYFQYDSFFVRMDGGPDPNPIFEVDCQQDGGDGYLWTVLNQRDPVMGDACEYVEDPWTAAWTTGPHTFELIFRESPAVARITITNDPGFVPM